MVALGKDGRVFAWGRSDMGQLGGAMTKSGVVPGLPSGVVGVSAGSESSMAWCADGSLYAWGWNEHGNLGLGHTVENVTVPTRVPIQNVSRVVAGGAAVFCVVK